MITLKKILLIEDDSDDQFLFLDAVNHISEKVECAVASNGKEALHYLQQQLPLPDAIFLDLNMPVMSGMELLVILKSEERFKNIPVIILTTSGNPVDIIKTKELGASSYLQKLPSYKGFINKLREVFHAQFQLNEFPS